MGSFRDDMAAGYGFEGPTIRIGRPFAARTDLAPGALSGPEPVGRGEIETAVEVGIPLAFLNRHGLIAGATGTGKTRTLQLIAEQASAAGCPVFAADLKGDLAGVGAPGDADEKLTARATELAHEWAPAACPVELMSLTGEDGVPLRATVTGFGATLLAKVLGLNETQESSLSLVFRFCDENGLPLVDLEDLRAALAYLTGPGKAELKRLGGISSSTAGVLLREVSQLEAEGGDVFFFDKDARALKAAVETFPMTDHYPDLAETLSSLGEGEAVVTVLDPRGVPTPVAATRLYPPASRMTPLTPEERSAILAASPLRPRYAERIDRESAAELLEARLAGDAARAEEVRERARPAPRRRAPRDDEGLAGQVEDILGSSVGRQVAREVVRGIFGMLRRRR